MNNDHIIGHLQIRVMEQLWDTGPSTVGQMHAALSPKSPRPLAYTTFLTVMRNLARRGFVSQTETGGRCHLFTPLVTRQEYRTTLAKTVVAVHFGGDLSAFVEAAR